MTFHDVPLRRLVDCLDGQRVPLNREQRADLAGDVPYWGSGGVVDHINKHLFDEPLVLLGEDGAPFFDKTRPVAFVIEGRSWVNNHIHVLRLRSMDPRFLSYALNAVDYGRYISGSTRDKLTQDEMWTIRIPCPDMDQQWRIATFLDNQIGRLDAATTARQRQAQQLEERGAVEIEALLSRNATGTVRLKYLCTGPGQYGLNVPAGEYVDSSVGVRMLRTSDIATATSWRRIEGIFVDAAVVRREERIRSGDILVSRAGTIGRAFIATQSVAGMTFAGFLIRFRNKPGVDPRFIALCLRSLSVQAQIREGAVTSTIDNFNAERYGNLHLPDLDTHDRQLVLNHAEAMIDGYQAAMDGLERSVALMQERKQALITAAVTGQFDVTTARAVA